MAEHAHLRHAATLKKLVKEGWFREPLRSKMVAALNRRIKESEEAKHDTNQDGIPKRDR